jgi:thiamine-monophosphate kinase
MLPSAPEGELWIGDDAAAVRVPSGEGWLLLTADTAVAGVHADLTLTGLDDLGWKAMAAAVSDIAAMGGEPVRALVTVSAPSGTDLQLLYRGIASASSELACPVVGGDLTNATGVVVTVAVVGWCGGEPIRRSGARPGDVIWLSGPVGVAAAGLRLLRAGQPSPAALRAHARPRPRLAEGLAARAAGATAMIDVSDGLVADLGHVATGSGVGIRLETVPVTAPATLEEALGGGEDFALVFCTAPSAPVVPAFDGLDTPVAIGRCTDDPAERTLAGRPLSAPGWEHRW